MCTLTSGLLTAITTVIAARRVRKRLYDCMLGNTGADNGSSSVYAACFYICVLMIITASGVMRIRSFLLCMPTIYLPAVMHDRDSGLWRRANRFAYGGIHIEFSGLPTDNSNHRRSGRMSSNLVLPIQFLKILRIFILLRELVRKKTSHPERSVAPPITSPHDHQ